MKGLAAPPPYPHGRGCSSGVEHDLAKVGVEGSNPFARSNSFMCDVVIGVPIGRSGRSSAARRR